MGKGNDGFCIFPLSSLQIGDLQSYLSDISLFLANDSKMLYILVDNRPWLRDLGYQSAHLWQLMVTKSRLSPFAISKSRGERKEVCESSTNSKQNKFLSWSSLIQELTVSRKKLMLPVKNLRNSLPFCFELHRTLYGFIVFEVAWNNVNGINYLNELQTDTLMYIQAKFMQRWEFDSVAQAASCMSLWFSGNLSEQMQLKEHLDSIAGDQNLSETGHIDKDDNICSSSMTANDGSINCLDTNIEPFSENTEQKTGIELTSPPTSGPCRRRKVINTFSANAEVESYCKEMKSVTNSETCSNVSEDAVEATQYKDVLISFRFNDHDLPFKLRDVIIFDLRLLTLLEAGLPSWVIFLQSYPAVCNLYRPWMCPLARVLYVTISLVTVLIGLYDLYKNVPILKATVAHLFGPLFDWIETWDMVSRVKYLGTMLFLHNLRKAFGWCLTFTNAARTFFSVHVRPLAKPLTTLLEFLLPTWNVLFEVAESIFYLVWEVIETLGDMVGVLLELLFTPLWYIVTVVWGVISSILYPILWITSEILYAPIRLLLAISGFMASIFTCMINILGATWEFVSGIFQFASSSEAAVSTSEVSMWHTLWKDLFSQIFRALRIILNGVAEFLAACNRHRLRENVGLLGLTRVGSRRVVQISAGFMIFFSMLGKFGAVFASIPFPIFTALYCILFGLVASVGISFLQFTNMNSMRNLIITGLSLFLGISIPQFFNDYWSPPHHGLVHTNAGWFNALINTIFSSPATVALIVAVFLDNTLKVDKSKKDRGMTWWGKFRKFKGDSKNEEFYTLPFNLNRFFPPT